MKKRRRSPFNIFSEAWQITWDNKILWAFGFFAGLYLGNNNYSNFHVQGGSWIFQNVSGLLSPNVVIVILMIVVAFIFWILGTLARISLIREVATLDAHKNKPHLLFMESVRLSSNLVPRILLIQLLVLFPVIIVGLLGLFFSQPPATNSSSIVLLLGAGLVLISIPLLFVDAFAYRGIVINGLGILDSIKAAFQFIKQNAGVILQLSLICAIVGAIFAFIVSFVLTPTLLFVTNSLVKDVSACPPTNGVAAMISCTQKLGVDPNIVTVNIIASLLVAALFSIITTLQSTAFTLAYKEFVEVKKPA
jgi:hypothetical protein